MEKLPETFDDVLMGEWLDALKSSYYNIYAEFELGLLDKAVLMNNKNVYEYDKKLNKFKKSNLQYNQEEEYLLVRLNKLDENDVPHFTFSFLTDTLPFYKTVLNMIIEKFILRKKYNKLKKENTDELKESDEGAEQT